MRRSLKDFLEADVFCMDFVFCYYYCTPYGHDLVEIFAELGLPPEIALEIHKHLQEAYDEILDEHFALVDHRFSVLLPSIKNFGFKRAYCSSIKEALRWRATITDISNYDDF
jgi:hypothetical protein